MSNVNFIDYVKICCRSGKGGAGSAHLHRDKITAKGGPDGGDGGRGGHVILKGNQQLWTLLHLKYKKHLIAKEGMPGESNQKTGKEGDNITIEVPLGTVIRDAETHEILFEINEHQEEVIIAQGGKGGLGNVNFKSATMQTPRFSQPGEEGIEVWRILELKVLADVGLVGFPNAGKSTLLSVITAAKPKIAHYPFTTLVPNLGIVQYRNYKSFIVADIPGIIEGAHQGKGIGHRFLKHIERNALLLFMVPADSNNIKQEYEILVRELGEFNRELLDKDRLLAITKCDMLDEELTTELKKELPTEVESIFISSVAQIGLTELKDKLWKKLNN